MIVSGGVSGGHLNPAVTVAVATIGKFPWWKVSHLCCLLLCTIYCHHSGSPLHSCSVLGLILCILCCLPCLLGCTCVVRVLSNLKQKNHFYIEGMNMIVENIDLFLKRLEYSQHFHLLILLMLVAYLTNFSGQHCFLFVYVPSLIIGI